MTDTIDLSATQRDMPALPEYRAQARAWITANLERKADDASAGEVKDSAAMAAHRALQRKVYDAGYSGIAWPVEYGGQGLPPEYELAFEEEAADFVLPAYALHSGTFGCNVPTMLVHAQPEFLRWFVPQVLRGRDLDLQVLLRALGRVGPGRRPDAGHARRGHLDPERPEDLEHLRAPGGLGVLPGPHRLGQAQAPRPDLVRVPHQPARRDDPADPPGR